MKSKSGWLPWQAWVTVAVLAVSLEMPDAAAQRRRPVQDNPAAGEAVDDQEAGSAIESAGTPAVKPAAPQENAAVADAIESNLPPLVISELSQMRQERDRLIERVLIPGGVRDPRTLEAIRHTPRHTFIPDALRNEAYLDKALPIGEAQTISSPYIVAVMTEALDPQPDDKVLEIGTGSGYQAAVLSPLVSHVYTIEIVEPIGRETALFLQGLGYQNITCKVGDGYAGWAEHAPFQKIIVTCSPSQVPQPLIDQLAEGGLMVIPVGTSYQQLLHVFRKSGGQLKSESTRPTLFVPMTGAAEQARKPDAEKAFGVINGDFEEAGESDQIIPGWYYEFNARRVMDDDSPFGPHVVEFSSQDGELPSLLIQGFRLDARQTPIVRLRAAVRVENVIPAAAPHQAPMVSLRMLDENREVLGTYWLGPYSGTRRWKVDQQTLRLHPGCREALVQIGLFGATGTVRFDGISVEPKRR